nr:DNA-directed DNA polymerase [Tanacetum cinerariifolium]
MCTRSNSYPNNSNATIPRRLNRRRVPNIVEPEIRTIEEVVPMADRTIEELLQAPTEGYGEAIIISKILVENFETKTNLLQLVQTNKFHGFERDNPHTRISNFKRMTSTLKYRDVPNDAIKLMLFPYSLEGAARIWYEKEPPNSILTWDDLVNKFVNQFFPPSKTTHLKNEISRFTQRFEETFGEAWERFKEMLRACPHHRFSELTQIDTFYNGLKEQDQDSLNAAAGGNILSKTTREALKIIENKSKVCYSISKSNVSRVNINSRESSSKTDDRIDKLADQISNLVEIVNKQVITPASAKAEENLRRNLNNDMRSILGSFFQNQDSTLGTLLSNTVPNPKGEMKVVTTRSGLAYEGPSIPTNFPLDMLLDALLLMPKFASTIKSLLTNKDKLFELAKVPLNENFSAMLLKKLPEKLGDPGKFLIQCDFLGIDVCHALADLGARINLMPLSIWKKLSLPELTPTQMTLELADRSITRPKGVAEDIFVKVGKFHFPTDLPSQLPLMDLKQAEETKAKSSIEEPSELELKELPSHLEYAFLEETDKLPVIIANDLKDVEKEALLKVLKSHKRAIAWKISDIKGIDPRFCTHKILMEEDYKPIVQSQRRVNPKNHDVIKKEVIKLFDAEMIYPISDSPWKTTFTCLYGTFAYRRMPFGLCNAPGTFQRCMVAIFHDMIEKTIEGFMDDFSSFGDSFSSCLSNLDKMIKWCEDTNLVLNWEKCHFMCKEGIILGDKFSKSGIEVDRAKVDVIAKLPHPTTIKGVRSFLGHAGFYRRFIQDFSKIARPMTHLLKKETPFVFSKDCVDAFDTLKKKLTEAPILVVPDWNLPFELMCDASDFAIGSVLGQRKMKHFQPIHYASKTMTEA